MASACGGWRRVLAWLSGGLIDRGVHHVRAAACGVGECVRVTYSKCVDRRRGVRHAVWSNRRMRARLAGLSGREVAHALCHSEGEDAGMILQNCWQYGSI
jgi:hypothetical protein